MFVYFQGSLNEDGHYQAYARLDSYNENLHSHFVQHCWKGSSRTMLNKDYEQYIPLPNTICTIQQSTYYVHITEVQTTNDFTYYNQSGKPSYFRNSSESDVLHYYMQHDLIKDIYRFINSAIDDSPYEYDKMIIKTVLKEYIDILYYLEENGPSSRIQMKLAIPDNQVPKRLHLFLDYKDHIPFMLQLRLLDFANGCFIISDRGWRLLHKHQHIREEERKKQEEYEKKVAYYRANPASAPLQPDGTKLCKYCSRFMKEEDVMCKYCRKGNFS